MDSARSEGTIGITGESPSERRQRLVARLRERAQEIGTEVPATVLIVDVARAERVRASEVVSAMWDLIDADQFDYSIDAKVAVRS